jgi:hypothetical protein
VKDTLTPRPPAAGSLILKSCHLLAIARRWHDFN